MHGRELTLVTFMLVAGLGCGPSPISAQSETESSTQGDGDGDGDGDDPGDGDGDSAWCSADLGAELEPMLADLQTIVDGAIAYFEAEHPLDDLPLHRCPHPIGAPSAGEASFTPDVSRNCNEGPACRCVSIMNGGGVGFYPLEDWTNNSVWQELGFAKEGAHAFHYNFIAINDTSGYGSCSFTAKAWGDLDDDALFSTYERRGTIDENGVNLEPLYVELGDE